MYRASEAGGALDDSAIGAGLGLRKEKEKKKKRGRGRDEARPRHALTSVAEADKNAMIKNWWDATVEAFRFSSISSAAPRHWTPP